MSAVERRLPSSKGPKSRLTRLPEKLATQQATIRGDHVGQLLFGCERIDFVGNPIILDQQGEQCPGQQQGPAILAPRSERELQRDIHEVRRAVADIRQESENDEDYERGMSVTRRDAH